MQVYALVNPPPGVLGDGCAALFAGEEWRCLFGQYRMPLGARSRSIDIISTVITTTVCHYYCLFLIVLFMFCL